MSIEQRAHLNAMAFIRLSAEMTDGGRVHEDDDSILCFANSPLPFLNVAATLDGTGDPERLLARADEFFGAHDAGYVVYTRDGHDGEQPLADLCEARGWFPYPHYPEMLLRGRLEEPALPEACDLAPATTAEDARAYWQLCNESYPSIGFPPNTFDSFPDELITSEEVRAWIARVDGEPAACALGYIAEGITFVGWVAAVEKARRRGLGALCTARVVNDCADAGAEFAALQASPMGESVYKRLGFEEIYNYKLWIKPPPPPHDDARPS